MADDVARAQRALYHRLRSIAEDALFVETVARVYGRSVVPNARGGLWYVAPALRAHVAYFKSTDGHTNQCDFSLKRLNLHLVPVAEREDGVMLVDSTRRGKRIPDAFSKTVPIWCAVLNYACFGEAELFCPPGLVAPSEVSAIRARVPEWAARFKSVAASNVPKLRRPLRPLFVFADTLLPDKVTTVFDNYTPIILVTASKPTADGVDRERGFSYVQGAGDDHELWAPKGFDANVMWTLDLVALQAAGERECREMVDAAIANRPNDAEFHVRATPRIAILSTPPPPDRDTIVLDLRDLPPLGEGHWPLADSKNGARALGQSLPAICTYFEASKKQSVAIVATLELGVALALLLDCRYYSDDGSRCTTQLFVGKEKVRQRAVRIYAGAGHAPSRLTANVVGNFLRK